VVESGAFGAALLPGTWALPSELPVGALFAVARLAMKEVEKGIARELCRAGMRELDPRMRSAAAVRVDCYLRSHCLHHLGTRRVRGSPHSTVDDAIQDVLVAVVRSGFKGGTDEQAAAWLSRVLRNAVGRQERDGRRHAESQPPALQVSATHPVDFSAELREVTGVAVALILKEIGRKPRRHNARTLEVDFDLWLCASLGESIASQVKRAASLLVRRASVTKRVESGGEVSRASARIRQRRHRGRLAAVRALEHLHRTDSWPAELDLALAVIGLRPL
jgi:DNA-directed RNA polymerase specialized sigma24 family protein